MATNCAYCDQVMWGGVKFQGMRFCGRKCQRKAIALVGDRPITAEQVNQEVDRLRHSNCPRCGVPGPIDVYESHRILSLIIVTSWSTHQHLCCPGCARHAIRQDFLFSLLAGWWGFPFGVMLTPFQLLRNLIGTPSSSIPPKRPSPKLRKLVQAQLLQTNLDYAKQGIAAPINLSSPLPSLPASVEVDRSLDSPSIETATATVIEEKPQPVKAPADFAQQVDTYFRRHNGLPLLLRIVLLGLPSGFLMMDFNKLPSLSILGFLIAIAIVCPWLEDKIQAELPWLKPTWARGLVWLVGIFIGGAGLSPTN